MALMACRGSCHVLTPSEAMRRQLIEFLPRSVPISVLPHAVDLEFFNRSATFDVDLPRALRGQGRPRLGYVAHAWAHKGHAYLLRAYRRIIRDYPDAVLALTIDANNTADGEDETLARRLMNDAADLPGVLFLGPQGPRAVRALYEWCDVVVYPSLMESFGFPVLEAMAMGKPIVCSDIDALAELANDCALYHTAGNEEHLARQVLGILVDGRRASRMGQRAMERARLFGWSAYAETLLTVLVAAAEGGRSDSV
jgi:glycosyltransferase involved in cell wall biosynthesis